MKRTGISITSSKSLNQSFSNPINNLITTMRTIFKFFTILILSSLFISFLVNCQVDRSPEWIKIDGNRFVNESGQTMIFQGVNIADPDKLDKAGKWQIEHFEEAKNWGANIIRLPIHPETWRERGSEDYIRLIDQAVEWSRELGLYLILDWHSIGNLKAELFQNKGYITTREETYEFWHTMSKKYTNEPVIAMY